MSYRISKRADADFDEIWTHVAQDSTEAADRLEDEIHRAVCLLGRMPGLGHRRPDVTDDRYRFWSVVKYVVAYRVEAKTIVVVRVVHGARDFRAIFG